MIALDGKRRKVQAANVKGIFRIIQASSSPKVNSYGTSAYEQAHLHSVCTSFDSNSTILTTTGTATAWIFPSAITIPFRGGRNVLRGWRQLRRDHNV